MVDHHGVVKFQAEKHEIVVTEDFHSLTDYVVYLMHLKAYETARELAMNKKVLDVGCNNGYGTYIISSVSAGTIGVDVSPRAIETATQKYGSAGLEFHLIDGNTLPFEEGTFDLLVSFQVIEHIADYQAYLAEIIRVLAPGGTAIFTTPNGQLRLDPGMKPWNPFHVREFSAVELETLLVDYFYSVEIKGLFGKDHIYAVEKQRVIRARDAARQKNAKWYYRLYSRLRPLLPAPLLDQIRTLRRSTDQKMQGELLTAAEMKRFSTADLYYQANSLDKALDLMAVCKKKGNHTG